jgi:hypothetical protein
MTAGACSDIIKIWDIRKTDQPLLSLRGHTTTNMRKRGIHHPAFVSPEKGGKTYIVSGGDNVGGLSIFDICAGGEGGGLKAGDVNAVSRGKIGDGDADVSALTVYKDNDGWGFKIACSAGETIHLLTV